MNKPVYRPRLLIVLFLGIPSAVFWLVLYLLIRACTV